MNAVRFVLASASPRRRDLLTQIGFAPDVILAPDIDETPHDREIPRQHAERLAREKALKAHQAGDVTLAADTVVAVGRRILPKTETEDETRACLALLSGRGHRVFTAVAVIDAQGRMRERTGEARVRIKRLTDAEIDAYIKSDEWRGKAGGYGVQGRAGALVIDIVGSYTAIVGLPVYEAARLLEASGLKQR